jgi:hypothetical protein
MEPVTKKTKMENRKLLRFQLSPVCQRYSQVAKVKHDRGEAVQGQTGCPVPNTVHEHPERASTADEECPPVPSILLGTQEEVYFVSPLSPTGLGNHSHVPRMVTVAVVKPTTMNVRKRNPKA